MSLAPKIDEVSTCVQNANYDLVCITETWLRRHIPDSAVNITGYNLIRLDRKEAIHGGVCLYVKDHIPFSILEDFGDDNNNLLEVLWVKLRPPRLPRGFSNIVVGLIYHPPTANSSIMLEYLTNCLSPLEANHASSGVILLGDLNQLNTSRLSSNFGLKQTVNFGTRGANTLDKVLTNLQHFYDSPQKRPGFGLSDHFSVEVKPKQRSNASRTKQKITSRDMRPTNRLAMRTYLEQVNVAEMIKTASPCVDKTSLLQLTIKTGLMPSCPKGQSMYRLLGRAGLIHP